MHARGFVVVLAARDQPRTDDSIVLVDCPHTLAGALIIGVIQVVLVLQGLRTEWQYLIAGMIVLGVIALQTQGTRD